MCKHANSTAFDSLEKSPTIMLFRLPKHGLHLPFCLETVIIIDKKYAAITVGRLPFTS